MRVRLWLSESFTFTWQSTVYRLILKYTVCVLPLTLALFTIFMLFWVIINESGGRWLIVHHILLTSALWQSWQTFGEKNEGHEYAFVIIVTNWALYCTSSGFYSRQSCFTGYTRTGIRCVLTPHTAKLSQVTNK